MKLEKAPFNILWLISAILCLLVIQWNLSNLGTNLIPRNLLTWAIITLSAAWCWSCALVNDRFKSHPILWILFIPPLVVLLFAAVGKEGPFPHYNAVAIFYFLMAALWVVGLVQTEVSLSQWEKIAWTNAIGAMALALVTLMSPNYFDLATLHQAIPFPLRMHEGGFQQRNVFASYLGSSNAVLIWAICKQEEKISLPKKIGIVLMALLTGLIIFNGGSRTAYVSLMASAGCLTFWCCKYHSKHTKSVLYWAACLVLVLIFSINLSWFGLSVKDPILSRSTDLIGGQSTVLRMDFWRACWYSFLQAPFFGQGLGRFIEIYPQAYSALRESGVQLEYGVIDHPHNETLLWLVETGLVGVLLILGPWLLLTAWLMKQRGFYSVGFFGALIPIAVHTQTEFPLHASGLHTWLVGIVFAMALSQEKLNDFTVHIRRHLKILIVSAVGSLAVLVAAFLIDSARISNSILINSEKLKAHPIEFLEQETTPVEFEHPLLGQFAQDTFTRYTIMSVLALDNKTLNEMWLPRVQLMYLRTPNPFNCNALGLLTKRNNEKASAELEECQKLNAYIANTKKE